MSSVSPTLSCSEPACSATLSKLDKWNMIKAQDAGWFFQRSGIAWCPRHNPPWVAEWRARQVDKGFTLRQSAVSVPRKQAP